MEEAKKQALMQVTKEQREMAERVREAADEVGDEAIAALCTRVIEAFILGTRVATDDLELIADFDAVSEE